MRWGAGRGGEVGALECLLVQRSGVVEVRRGWVGCLAVCARVSSVVRPWPQLSLASEEATWRLVTEGGSLASQQAWQLVGWGHPHQAYA